MSTFLSIRNYVYFRHLFDAVHPLFWPVLYWQLKAAWLSLQREKLTSVMLAVTWWGGVRIVYRGDKIETPKHDPLAPLRPRFDDPIWSTRLPACLDTIATSRLFPILPLFTGEVSPQVTEGARPRHPIPNTSQGGIHPAIRPARTTPPWPAHPGESREPEQRQAQHGKAGSRPAPG